MPPPRTGILRALQDGERVGVGWVPSARTLTSALGQPPAASGPARARPRRGRGEWVMSESMISGVEKRGRGHAYARAYNPCTQAHTLCLDIQPELRPNESLSLPPSFSLSPTSSVPSPLPPLALSLDRFPTPSFPPCPLPLPLSPPPLPSPPPSLSRLPGYTAGSAAA